MPHEYSYGDTFEVEPKLGGGFELNPASFQNLLGFVCSLSFWQHHSKC